MNDGTYLVEVRTSTTFMVTVDAGSEEQALERVQDMAPETLVMAAQYQSTEYDRVLGAVTINKREHQCRIPTPEETANYSEEYGMYW